MQIANSPAIAAPTPEPSASEPISPELVLVDPELRRAILIHAQAELERARLQVVPSAEPFRPEPKAEPGPVARPMLVPLPERPAPVSRPARLPPLSPRPPAWPHRYLVPVVLPISLALNAILIAFAVSDATNSPQPAPAPPALDVTVPGKSGQQPAAPSRAVRKPRNGAVERKLLNLIVQAPAGKLPGALIDSRTGLARNGLQAVCRRETRGTFLCVVQPAKHKPGEGLYVRYRMNRKGNGGTFKWYRYRSG
jgi:hypothetical protein